MKPGVTSRCPLAIVGGGILGRVLALLAAKAGWKGVLVFQSGDGNALAADSQRNHSWGQSGLLYGVSNPVAAEKMMLSRKNLLEAAAVREPTERGIFRTSATEGDDLLERGERLRMKIQRIGQDEARRALGPFFADGFEHYSVPDTLIDEAAILQRLQLRAEEYGVKFLVAKVAVRRLNERALLEVGDEVLEPSRVVFCAGAGTPALLEQLGLANPLHIFQSPLLVMYCGVVMQVPLLADISKMTDTSGLTIVQHNVSVADPTGRCVIGNRGRTEISREAVPITRCLSESEQLGLRSLLPPALFDCRHRFTAGWKTEATVNGRSSIDPWIGQWPDCPNVLAAVPGKATLSFHVARMLLERLGPPCSLNERSFDVSLGKPVSRVSPMHESPEFDDVLDEREATHDQSKKIK